MDKVCPKCGNWVSAEDPKGDGVYLVWYCEECGDYIENLNKRLGDK